METIVAWDAPVVVLSIAIAIAGSYMTLDFASRIKAHPKNSKTLWYVGGAFIMGLTIGSINFIAMLVAYYYRVPKAFGEINTLLSASHLHRSNLLLLANVIFGFALLILCCRSYLENQTIKKLNKQIEEANITLKEKEKRLRRLVDANLIGIVTGDMQGNILEANDFFLKMIGYSREELMAGKIRWKQMTPPEYIASDQHAIESLRQTGTCEPYEKQFITKNGSRVDIIIGIAMFENSSELSIAFIMDVTQRKQAETQLYRNTLLLSSVIENIPNMIFLKEAHHLRFEMFNKAGEELLGYDRNELSGKNDYDFFPKDQAEFFIQEDKNTLENKVMVDIPEEPIQTKSHGLRFLHTKKVPIIDDQGEAQFLLGISEDITEQKLAQEKIQQLTEALENKVNHLNAVNQELEAFSYSVSHDLRAPLRSIDGFSQALLEDYDDKLDDKGRQYLNFLRESSQQMASLIDDMLQLSRLTRGTINIEPHVNLTAMAEEVINIMRQQDPERDVTVEVEPNLMVKGDPRLLRAVLQNLLGNAWKFTSRHPQAHIKFKTMQQVGKTVYYIQDDGAGFEMAYANKLFGAFQRLHDTTEFPGNGIGLATVARILNRHGGKIWGESEIEKGATFYFTLASTAVPEETTHEFA